MIFQEVLLPNSVAPLQPGTSTFYTAEGDKNVLLEDDNFFEDMTSLYKRQKVLFQRSCDQLKVYKLIAINRKTPHLLIIKSKKKGI